MNKLSFGAAVAAFTATHGRPPTILVDADGVLYQWETAFVDAHRRTYPHISIGDAGTRERFDFFAAAPDEERRAALHILNTMDYSALQLMPGARDAMTFLLESGADVLICTSPTLGNVTCESDKKVAILFDFGREIADTRLLIQRDKTYALGDILIDDKPQVTGRRTPTWKHIRFTQRYNEGLPGPRIEAWTDPEWVNVLSATIGRMAGVPALSGVS